MITVFIRYEIDPFKREAFNFAKAGVARLSLGGALAFSAYGAMMETAEEILTHRRFTAVAARRSGARKIAHWLK